MLGMQLEARLQDGRIDVDAHHLVETAPQRRGHVVAAARADHDRGAPLPAREAERKLVDPADVAALRGRVLRLGTQVEEPLVIVAIGARVHSCAPLAGLPNDSVTPGARSMRLYGEKRASETE